MLLLAGACAGGRAKRGVDRRGDRRAVAPSAEGRPPARPLSLRTRAFSLPARAPGVEPSVPGSPQFPGLLPHRPRAGGRCPALGPARPPGVADASVVRGFALSPTLCRLACRDAPAPPTGPGSAARALLPAAIRCRYVPAVPPVGARGEGPELRPASASRAPPGPPRAFLLGRPPTPSYFAVMPLPLILGARKGGKRTRDTRRGPWWDLWMSGRWPSFTRESSGERPPPVTVPGRDGRRVPPFSAPHAAARRVSSGMRRRVPAADRGVRSSVGAHGWSIWIRRRGPAPPPSIPGRALAPTPQPVATARR